MQAFKSERLTTLAVAAMSGASVQRQAREELLRYAEAHGQTDLLAPEVVDVGLGAERMDILATGLLFLIRDVEIHNHETGDSLAAAILPDVAAQALRYFLSVSEHPIKRSGEYDGVEVHAVVKFEGGICEIDDGEANPSMFSVYLHRAGGGLECVADFPIGDVGIEIARASANTCARALEGVL